jgi:hypothetical protein
MINQPLPRYGVWFIARDPLTKEPVFERPSGSPPYDSDDEDDAAHLAEITSLVARRPAIVWDNHNDRQVACYGEKS